LLEIFSLVTADIFLIICWLSFFDGEFYLEVLI
jgi:hypothetical protein